MKKVQLEDLARQLGVSKTLISMVVNGKGNYYGVSKKTQAMVMEAVEREDYRPNRSARSFRSGKSHFIALIVSDISNPFFSAVAASIEKVLAAKGYNLMVCSTEEEQEKEKMIVRTLIDQHAVDGMIIASAAQDASAYSGDRLKDLPVVFVDRVVPLHRANFVVCDNYGGAFELVRHLWEKGKRNIVCLAITPLSISSVEDRINGYRDVLLKEGKEGVTDDLFVIRYQAIRNDIELALEKCLMRKELPDAFFCLNNNIAVSLLSLLKHEKYASFSNAQVACFDDLPVFDLLARPVTAVAQPAAEIGDRAAELLLQLISGGKQEHHQVVLPTRLVKR